MKQSSRSILAAFTILAIALAVPAAARADRVVLYPLTGRADQDRLDDLEDHVDRVLRELGHEVLAAPGGLSTIDRPATAAEMEGVATAAGATYVLAIEIEPLRAQYRMHVRVGYQPTGRVEELTLTVLESEEHDRLTAVMRAMLRPEGLGEDAMRLTGDAADQGAISEEERLRREEEERARLAAEEEARRRAEEEERAREEEERRRAEERAAREAEEAAQRARDAWTNRATYGSDGEWVVLVGGGASYAYLFTPARVIRDAMLIGTTTDAGFGLIEARLGRAFPGTDGLELRGGIDVFLGASGGMNVVLGAVWQLTPLAGVPIHLGPSIELGGSFSFTGGQNAGFVARASMVASWTPTPHFQLEVALPELGVQTNAGLVLGAALRAGYRF